LGLLPSRDNDFFLHFLVAEMVDCGHLIAAAKLVKKFNLIGVEIAEALIMKERARRLQLYLSLPFGMERVIVVCLLNLKANL